MPWRFNPFTGNLDETDIPAFNGEVTLGSAASPSIFFTGDPNTGIYSPGADQVALSTNGTGRLFVDASGNVKIGTTIEGHANADNLTISSSGACGITIRSENSNDGVIYFSDATAGTGEYDGQIEYLHSDQAMRFATAATERLRITSAGLVGIGTSSVNSLLHLKTSANNNLSVIEAGTDNGNQIFKLGTGGGGAAYMQLKDSSGGVKVAFSTTGSSYFTGGSLGIGTTNPGYTLDVVGSTSAARVGKLRLLDDSPFLTGANLVSNSAFALGTDGAAPLSFFTSNTERARIDSSGRLLVGTPSAVGDGFLQVGLRASIFRANTDAFAPSFRLDKIRGSSTVNSSDAVGEIVFRGYDGTNFLTAASIASVVDGTPGANDMPGRLVFSTTADGASSPTERMSIKNNGNILVGSNSDAGFTFQVSKASGAAGFFNRNTDDGAVVGFGRQASLVGTISVTTTATAYNTSSDYRLKENVTAVTDGITRLQQLKPSRFNFIADPDTVVDGFIAHEVQTIVPEAITGEKDAVDDEGNPQYQGIDQSKLVPLLTAALQEAVAKIESLEARLTAAGI